MSEPNVFHSFTSAITKILNDFTLLPTEDELRRNFPHSAECTCDKSGDVEHQVAADLWDYDRGTVTASNLERAEEYTLVPNSVGAWSLSLFNRIFILRCQYCGVKKEYRKP